MAPMGRRQQAEKVLSPQNSPLWYYHIQEAGLSVVELGWTAVNVMYVEYVFVGHGLIDYCRPVAGRPPLHCTVQLRPKGQLGSGVATKGVHRSGSHMMMIIMSENGAFSIPSSNNCTRPAMQCERSTRANRDTTLLVVMSHNIGKPCLNYFVYYIIKHLVGLILALLSDNNNDLDNLD